MKICCFTGHRHIDESARPRLLCLLDNTLEELYAQGFTVFRTGGARGFDTLAALRVLALKEKHPDCQLVLYLPHPTQADSWREGERALWQEIKEKADRVHTVSPTYTPECMHARNRALVTGADLCMAYLTENKGGTLYTCTYALKNGVPLRNLSYELSLT